MGQQLSGSAMEQVETMMFQVAAAFGQGAGTMLIDVDGVRTLRQVYVPRFQDYDGASWPDDVLVACEWARALGRIAAGHATTRGGMAIQTVDVENALERGSQMHEFPFGRCPYCREG